MDTLKQATHVALPVSLVNRTLDYLVCQPFKEVFELIAALKQAADASFIEQSSCAPDEPR